MFILSFFCVFVCFFFFFFFNDTATTEIYTLSLHDALPIYCEMSKVAEISARSAPCRTTSAPARPPARSCRDRKSTRLNSSHSQISYAVFCLKKKKKKKTTKNKNKKNTSIQYTTNIKT